MQQLNDNSVSPGSAGPSRTASPTVDGVAVTTFVAGGVVAVVAAVASYQHMLELAAHAGQGWLAWLLPLSVDGMVVAASMAIVVSKRQGRPVTKMSVFALFLGLAVSVVANVLSSASELPPGTTEVVSAWPPIALAVSYELVLSIFRHRSDDTTTDEESTGPAIDGRDRPAASMLTPEAVSSFGGRGNDRAVTGAHQDEADWASADTPPADVEGPDAATDNRPGPVEVLAGQLRAGHTLTGRQASIVTGRSERQARRYLTEARARIQEEHEHSHPWHERVSPRKGAADVGHRELVGVT